MTRDNDNKMDTSRNRLDDFTAKSESRFDKQMRATMGQDGQVNDRKIDKLHRTEGKGDGRF